MIDFEDIPNSEILKAIDEYVHSKRNREILKRRFIDGEIFEKIAEEFDMSPRQIKAIVYKHGDRVLRHLTSS